ncbi:hypothetical protein ACLOJK_031349 [Asimina triloba]
MVSDQQGSAYEFGELEEALMPKLLQGAGIRSDDDRKSIFSIRPPTLEIFPSWPMRFHQTERVNSQSAESTDSGSAQNTVSCKADTHLEPESPISNKASDQSSEQQSLQQPQRVDMASDADRSGPPNQVQPKTTDKKWLGLFTWEAMLTSQTISTDLMAYKWADYKYQSGPDAALDCILRLISELPAKAMPGFGKWW